MSNVLPWLDGMLSETEGHENEDGLKNVISALAYLADADGVVMSSQIDEHFNLPPNTTWQGTGYRGFVLDTEKFE